MTRAWKTHILLGKGGQTPGLTVYDVVSQSEMPVEILFGVDKRPVLRQGRGPGSLAFPGEIEVTDA